MSSIWQEEFKIRSYEVDSRNRLRPTELFNFMQEAAGNHAYELGCGYDDLIGQNYIWVLSRMKVRMERYPAWGETFRIETWPKGAFRLYAARDFSFIGQDGSVIGGATSIWLLLDVNTMRPQRVENLKFNYHEHEERHGLDEMLEKLHFDGRLEASYERVVNYNDIDVNCHANNARYVDWIMDCFPVELLSERPVRTLQVNYLSEAKPEESLIISRYADSCGSSAFLLEGVNKASKNAVFQSKVEF